MLTHSYPIGPGPAHATCGDAGLEFPSRDSYSARTADNWRILESTPLGRRPTRYGRAAQRQWRHQGCPQPHPEQEDLLGGRAIAAAADGLADGLPCPPTVV